MLSGSGASAPSRNLCPQNGTKAPAPSVDLSLICVAAGTNAAAEAVVTVRIRSSSSCLLLLLLLSLLRVDGVGPPVVSDIGMVTTCSSDDSWQSETELSEWSASPFLLSSEVVLLGGFASMQAVRKASSAAIKPPTTNTVLGEATSLRTAK